MFLSIIIPNYNYGKYFSLALESLYDQNSDDFEIVIIDDASTDNSIEIIDEFSKKMTNLIVKVMNAYRIRLSHQLNSL